MPNSFASQAEPPRMLWRLISVSQYIPRTAPDAAAPAEIAGQVDEFPTQR